MSQCKGHLSLGGLRGLQKADPKVKRFEMPSPETNFSLCVKSGFTTCLFFAFLGFCLGRIPSTKMGTHLKFGPNSSALCFPNPLMRKSNHISLIFSHFQKHTPTHITTFCLFQVTYVHFKKYKTFFRRPFLPFKCGRQHFIQNSVLKRRKYPNAGWWAPLESLYWLAPTKR